MLGWRGCGEAKRALEACWWNIPQRWSFGIIHIIHQMKNQWVSKKVWNLSGIVFFECSDLCYVSKRKIITVIIIFELLHIYDLGSNKTSVCVLIGFTSLLTFLILPPSSPTLTHNLMTSCQTGFHKQLFDSFIPPYPSPLYLPQGSSEWKQICSPSGLAVTDEIEINPINYQELIFVNINECMLNFDILGNFTCWSHVLMSASKSQWKSSLVRPAEHLEHVQRGTGLHWELLD